MKLDVYLNGDHARSTNDIRYLQSSVAFCIGSFTNARNPFLGTIASVMIYNTALSSSVIADLARYLPVQQDSERLFVKLRPEVLSEKIGSTVHLLGVMTVEMRRLYYVDYAARSGRRGRRGRTCAYECGRGRRR